MYKVNEIKGNKSETLISTNVASFHLKSSVGSYIANDKKLYNWGDYVGDGTETPSEQPYNALDGIIDSYTVLPYWNDDPTARIALSDDGSLYVLNSNYSCSYIKVASDAYLLLYNLGGGAGGTLGGYINFDGDIIAIYDDDDHVSFTTTVTDVRYPN